MESIEWENGLDEALETTPDVDLKNKSKAS